MCRKTCYAVAAALHSRLGEVALCIARGVGVDKTCRLKASLHGKFHQYIHLRCAACLYEGRLAYAAQEVFCHHGINEPCSLVGNVLRETRGVALAEEGKVTGVDGHTVSFRRLAPVLGYEVVGAIDYLARGALQVVECGYLLDESSHHIFDAHLVAVEVVYGSHCRLVTPAPDAHGVGELIDCNLVHPDCFCVYHGVSKKQANGSARTTAL